MAVEGSPEEDVGVEVVHVLLLQLMGLRNV